VAPSVLPLTWPLQRSGTDPIRAGFVASLPHPGGNLTGFANLENSVAGKCLELLMAIAPSVKRVAMMFNPDTAPGGGSFSLPLLEAAARSLHNRLPSPRRLPPLRVCTNSLMKASRAVSVISRAKYKPALSVAYGAGLWVSEVVALKVSDIDSARMMIRIRSGLSVSPAVPQRSRG
jgi:ABC transporter substrate binding protein